MDAGATVIDVREESEYADGHIACGASTSRSVRWPKASTRFPRISRLSSTVRVASAPPCRPPCLHIMGYDNVRAFPPSYAGWADAGGATE